MARFGRLFLITLLLVGLLLSTSVVLAGCGEETKTTTGATTAAQDNSKVISDRASQVLAVKPVTHTISSDELTTKLADPAEKAKLYLVDIRAKADYDKGHIEGATNIEFKNWADTENLNKLPKDKYIVVICYTGNTAAQTATGMRMLGYNADALKDGMNGWAVTDNTQRSVSELQNTSYPVVTTPATPTAPEPARTDSLAPPSDADYKILADAAKNMMSEMPTSGDYASFTITAEQLNTKLGNAAEKDKLFLLEIRQTADFNKGHIDGAVNIPFTSILVPDNLKMIPRDKKVVVVCYTGNTAAISTTLLRMLGYDAVVLKYGMMGWDGGGKDEYLQVIQAANKPVVTS